MPEYVNSARATFGKFTAERAGNILTITVRAFFSFPNTDQSRFGMPNLEWAGAERDEFRTAILERIPAFWNEKWKFRRGLEVVSPVFVIEPVEDGQQHIDFVCNKGTGPSGIKAAEIPPKLNLFEFDNDSVGSRSASSLSADRAILAPSLSILSSAVAKNSNVSVTRGDPWTVTASSAAELNNLAQVLVNIQSHDGNRYKDPSPVLYIEATSGARDKADKMTRAVLDHLRRQGVTTYPIFVSAVKTRPKAKWPWTPHKPTGTVTVRHQETGDYIDKRLWQNPYTVAIHEFGHCMGLPDEYMTSYGGGLGTALHEDWRRLCGEAHVPANLAADNNFCKSIMSYGCITSACHYVYAWDALRQITGGEAWEIVRGTETDT